MSNIDIRQGDCIELMKEIPDGSVDCIVTDPPYGYLKHKLDAPFDMQALFNEFDRVLKKDCFILSFGRGTQFYQWNVELAKRGYEFKEEIVWNKGYCTSPLMAMSRIHETVAVYAGGKSKIHKVKVPYLQMKKYDIPSIVSDIKRLMTTYSNHKSFEAVKRFLENNNLNEDGKIQKEYIHDVGGKDIVASKSLKYADQAVGIVQSISKGCREKSIIREDISKDQYVELQGASHIKNDKCCTVMQSIIFGNNEKSIIRETPDHYKAEHPTQKPVALLERLLNLISVAGDTVLDPFMGSGTTGIACQNLNRNFIGFEILPEYFDIAKKRLDDNAKQQKLF